MAFKDWSPTAIDNSTVPGINWQEGMQPKEINNSARQMMADLRKWASQTVLSVYDYGDPTVDIGDSLQQAHDALPADGGAIEIPAKVGTYPLLTTAAFTKSVVLIGAGWYDAEIYTTVLNIVCITTNTWLYVEKLHFSLYGSARTTGVSIKVLSDAHDHRHSTLDTVLIDGGKRGYWSQNTNAICVVNCAIFPEGDAGLYLENLTNPDIGDSFVIGNNMSAPNGACVLVKSTSGINFVGNKFNGAVDHVLISVGTLPTGNFLFSCNSFEGHSNTAIKAITTSPGVVTKIIIVCNQFSSQSSYHISLGLGAAEAVVHDNTLNGINNVYPFQGTGVLIEEGVAGVSVKNNYFYNITNAIISGASNPGLKVHGNTFAKSVRYPLQAVGGAPSAGRETDDIEIDLAVFCETTSDTDYRNVVLAQGAAQVELSWDGSIQGVSANAIAKRSFIMVDGAQFDEQVKIGLGGTMDLGYASSGSATLLGGKRATGIGTSISGTLRAKLRGNLTKVEILP